MNPEPPPIAWVIGLSGELNAPVSKTMRTSVATTLMPVGSYTENSWTASTSTIAAPATIGPSRARKRHPPQRAIEQRLLLHLRRRTGGATSRPIPQAVARASRRVSRRTAQRRRGSRDRSSSRADRTNCFHPYANVIEGMSNEIGRTTQKHRAKSRAASEHDRGGERKQRREHRDAPVVRAAFGRSTRAEAIDAQLGNTVGFEASCTTIHRHRQHQQSVMTKGATAKLPWRGSGSWVMWRNANGDECGMEGDQ